MRQYTRRVRRLVLAFFEVTPVSLERVSMNASLIDVLDRVLDKGIVIDAWLRISLVGIDLLTIEARIVVASIETYLQRATAIGQLTPIS